jgi:hypothetical protein
LKIENWSVPESYRGAQNYNGSHVQVISQGGHDEAHDHSDGQSESRYQEMACVSCECLGSQQKSGKKALDDDQETEEVIAGEAERDAYQERQ